ncbi:MAG: lipopolysaccharide biosynthesis protein [Betaproteobacteria bacterium]|nr:lipopolysaccharide biosynthesis protein [Betaproteobacteria bacterium]
MSAGVEAGAVTPKTRGLGRRALTLGAANAFEYALQFLLPVVLVRCLDPEAFGQYRLLWLAVGTVMAILTQAMPGSLYYFLPRAQGGEKRLYINQALLFLLLAGLVAAWAVSRWNPWLPAQLDELARHEFIVPAFVLLWVVASLLDLLPTVEERVAWQARATLGLAALRAAALSLAAALTGELAPVLAVLLAFVAFKVAVLLYYIARFHGLRGPYLRRGAFAHQVRYVAPFGAASALYCLRLQADQWVAAALFSVASFAAFSIGALLGPLLTVLRKSVSHVFLPSMSRLQAAGDLHSMLALNSRANVIVGALAFPLLACAFVFAEEIVTLVFTTAYVEAAPVMRVYIAGLAALVIELASLTFLLQQGAFVLRLGLVALAVSVALSASLAQAFGLAGAAVGSTAVVYLDLCVTLRCIARRTGTPVRDLQDWRSLGRLLAFSALAAAFAWILVEHLLAGSGALARLATGGALLGAAYAAMTVTSATGRAWLAAGR